AGVERERGLVVEGDAERTARAGRQRVVLIDIVSALEAGGTAAPRHARGRLHARDTADRVRRPLRLGMRGRRRDGTQEEDGRREAEQTGQLVHGRYAASPIQPFLYRRAGAGSSSNLPDGNRV